ncbi:MAG: alkane 1-monooxygenase [Myxococcales bacterium]|nr:alkane 1-monooxygenase [Myxococcales bacterium]
MPVLPYLLAWVPAFAVLAAIVWGGWWLAAPPLLIFLLVPIADALSGEETRWGDEAEPLPRAPYRAMVLAWVPTQLALMAWGLSEALGGGRAAWEAAVLVVDLGLLGGATGITFAHEMMHRTERLERFAAELLMTTVSYPWFCVEHVHGHHKRVATPEDPATSRLGESLYAFLPRTVLGGLRSAVSFEKKQLAKRGRPLWHWRSRVVRWSVVLAGGYACAGLLWGVTGVAALVAMGVVGMLMLEGINYLEHYGLTRQKVVGPSGSLRYERVAPHHSWNSSHAVSNYMLINLARHSDHHAHAARPWERLRHFEDAPQLPSGYGAMFVLTFVPPLWFAVMNPRVADWRRRYGGESVSTAPSGRAVDG